MTAGRVSRPWRRAAGYSNWGVGTGDGVSGAAPVGPGVNAATPLSSAEDRHRSGYLLSEAVDNPGKIVMSAEARREWRRRAATAVSPAVFISSMGLMNAKCPSPNFIGQRASSILNPAPYEVCNNRPLFPNNLYTILLTDGKLAAINMGLRMARGGRIPP